MKPRTITLALAALLAASILRILFRRWHAQQEARDDAEFDAAAGELYRQSQNETDPLAGAVSLAELRRQRQERQS